MNAVELLSVAVVCISMAVLCFAALWYTSDDRSPRRRRQQQQHPPEITVAARQKPEQGLPKHIRETFPTFIYSAAAAEGQLGGPPPSWGPQGEAIRGVAAPAVSTEESVGAIGGSLRRGYAAIVAGVVGGIGGSLRMGGSGSGRTPGSAAVASSRAGESLRGGGGSLRSTSFRAHAAGQPGETWHGQCQLAGSSLHGGCGNSSCRVLAVAAAISAAGAPGAGQDAISSGRFSSHNSSMRDPSTLGDSSSATSAPPGEPPLLDARPSSFRSASASSNHGGEATTPRRAGLGCKHCEAHGSCMHSPRAAVEPRAASARHADPADASRGGATDGEGRDLEEGREHTCNDACAAGCACSWSSMCVICLAEFSDGDILLRVPCSHAFHVECINLWFESHSTCPICRLSLVPKDGGSGALTPTDGEATPDPEPQIDLGPTAALDPANATEVADLADNANGLGGQAVLPLSPSEGSSGPLAPGPEEQERSLGLALGSAGQGEASGGVNSAGGGEGGRIAAAGAGASGPVESGPPVAAMQKDEGRSSDSGTDVEAPAGGASHTSILIDADDGTGPHRRGATPPILQPMALSKNGTEQAGGPTGLEPLCEERVHRPANLLSIA